MSSERQGEGSIPPRGQGHSNPPYSNYLSDSYLEGGFSMKSQFSLLPATGGGVDVKIDMGVPLALGGNVVGSLPTRGGGKAPCGELRKCLNIAAGTKGVLEKHAILHTTSVLTGRVLLLAFGTVRIQKKPGNTRTAAGAIPTALAEVTTPTKTSPTSSGKGAATGRSEAAGTSSRTVKAGSQCYLMVGETLELDAGNAKPTYRYTLASSNPPVSPPGSPRTSGVKNGSGGSGGRKRPRSPLPATVFKSETFGESTEPWSGGRRAPMEHTASTARRTGSLFGAASGIGNAKRHLDLFSTSRRVGVTPPAARPTVVEVEDSDEEESGPSPAAIRDESLNGRAVPTAAVKAAVVNGDTYGRAAQATVRKRRRDRSSGKKTSSSPFNPAAVLDLTDDRGPKGLPVGFSCVEPVDLCDSEDDASPVGGNADSTGLAAKKAAAVTTAGASDSSVCTVRKECVAPEGSPAAPPAEVPPWTVCDPSDRAAAALGKTSASTDPTPSASFEETVTAGEVEVVATKMVEITPSSIEVPVVADSLASPKDEKPATDPVTDLLSATRHQAAEHASSKAPSCSAAASLPPLVCTPTGPSLKVIAADDGIDSKVSPPQVPSRRHKFGPMSTAALLPRPPSFREWKQVNPMLRSVLVSMIGNDPRDSLLITEEMLAREIAPSYAVCDAVVSALLRSRSSTRTQCIKRQLRAILTACPGHWHPPTTDGPGWLEGVMSGITDNIAGEHAAHPEPVSLGALEAHNVALELVVDYLVEARRSHDRRSRPAAEGGYGGWSAARGEAASAVAAAGAVSGASHADTLRQLFEWITPGRDDVCSSVAARDAARRAVKKCATWAWKCSIGGGSRFAAVAGLKPIDGVAPGSNNHYRRRSGTGLKRVSGKADTVQKAARVLTARLLGEVVEMCGLQATIACQVIKDEMLSGGDSPYTSAVATSSTLMYPRRQSAYDAAALALDHDARDVSASSGGVLEAGTCCNLLRALAGRSFTAELARLLLAEVRNGAVLVVGPDGNKRLQALLARQAAAERGVGLVERFSRL